MPASRSAIVSVFIISCLSTLALITLYLSYGPEVCHEGMFLCNRSGICIANKYKCNGYRDCLHGEDENNLTCADFHGGLHLYDTAVFSNWTRKKHYSVPCALNRYPSKCNCRNGTSLRCNAVGLTKVPGNVSNNLKRIAMINNSIVLSNDSFDGYYALTMIHLQYNELTRIPPFVFKHQRRLIWLYLLNNNLTVLDKDVFYGLDIAKNIFLDCNCLEFLNLNSWQHMAGLSWLDLSYNLLTFKNENFPYLKSLTILKLQWNRIETINEFMFAGLRNLGTLDLSHNMITVIHKNAFKNTVKLEKLNIINNQIVTITREILHPLKSLTKLAFGNNPIQRINANFFTEMENLSSLDMEGIDMDNIEMSLFNSLKKLEFLYLKEFHYCVLYAKHVNVCYPNTDGLSSSADLLPKPLFRWTLWIVNVFTLAMNVLVVYGRMFNTHRDENQAINFVIRNLAVADMLMVIYLTTIGYHDRMYGGEYFAHAQQWQSSNLCTLIGVTAVISSEVSMLILVFLSLERFLLIAVPFSGYQVLKLNTAVYCMVSIWLVGISISLAPLIMWRHSSKFYGSNGLCYPLYIEDPFVVGWQYSAFMFLGLHTASLSLMSVLYMLMFASVRKTRRAARISAGDFDFAVRFFFIVLANSLCWLPIIVLKLAAFRRIHVSSKIYGWVMVFVVPINALINPLLYTFTTPKYRTVITSMNIFKMPSRDSNSGAEMSYLSYPNSIMMLFSRTPKKIKNKIGEKQTEKTTTRDNSFETTINGE